MEAVLLIDDLRVFREDLPARIARTSAQGLADLQEAAVTGHRWEQVWLDHDLGDATGALDDVSPVVSWLVARAGEDRPAQIGTILVHSSNPPAAERVRGTLHAAGYRVLRVPAEQHLRVDPALQSHG